MQKKWLGSLGIVMCAALSLCAENKDDSDTACESQLDQAIIAADPQIAQDKSRTYPPRSAAQQAHAENVAKQLSKMPPEHSGYILSRMNPADSSHLFSKMTSQSKLPILKNMPRGDQDMMLERMSPNQKASVLKGLSPTDQKTLIMENPAFRP